MNRLPDLPVSAAIISDGSDVFLSFHFASESVSDAALLIRPLSFWLQLFLEQQGIVAVAVDVVDANE